METIAEAPSETAAPVRRSKPEQPRSGALAWVATFMLLVSAVNMLFRPDPTLVVCVFGIYVGGQPSSSNYALRAFAGATLLTIATDYVWWLTDDTIIAQTLASAEEFNHLPRVIQLPVCLTALNVVYKIILISISLLVAFASPEASVAAEIESPAPMPALTREPLR
eukprot:CAMPEP_0185163528 /NCGR_PEP_ID=MMETSP1139-20130426/8119_1 /TAXON_ID=298111 /ORGANISM="Pavlova sp., Strain CCMP459" /LENGTH=165 /DNA_ID=CAMNT_0027728885 /DNA_START=17 /DNA_END=514 /DNA_ORIENTATION=+